MSDSKLSRNGMLKVAGAAVAVSAATRFTPDAFALDAHAASGDGVIGVIDDVRGTTADVVTDAGARLSGSIKSRRGLVRGDRVVVVGGDGAAEVTPLYTDIAGIVESVDADAIVISKARYALDRESHARRRNGAAWAEVGAVDASANVGSAIQALGIFNQESNVTTIAIAWL